MENSKNIILRMPNWIGDAVMAEPIIFDLKQTFPDSRLTLMCQGQVGQLFRAYPFCDEIFSFSKPSGWIAHLRRDPLIDDLRKGEYDLGILLTDSFSSAWWFYRGQVKRRVGYRKNGRSFLLTDPITPPKEPDKIHQMDYYRNLLKGMGLSTSSHMPTLYVTDEEKRRADGFFSYERGGKKWVGINPGAHFGSAKCWPSERFRECVEELVKDRDLIVVLFGDNSQKELVDSIANGFGERVVNLAGKTTLRELMAIISRLTVLLTNDSGPMHIAQALQIPVVALFGSTSVVKTGPWGDAQVLCENVDCSPCFKRVCPIDFRCMKRIEVRKVLAQLDYFLRKK